MTTTLRPSGPEERAGDTWLQRYDIRVNGRTAGSLRLAAHDRHGVLTGVVRDLHVDPGDRRRGRATVAVLAAEEVLRARRCRRVSVAVPEDDPVPGRLAATLGYRPESLHMLKELGAPPPLPLGSLLRPFEDGEYAQWCRESGAGLTDHLTHLGATPEDAAASVERSRRGLLPLGTATAGMVLRVLEVREDGRAGSLWVQVDGAPREDADAWVYGVEVEAGLRGKGHGRTLLLAAEREALAAGAAVLGLNVHSDNGVARRLYRSLGYRTVQTHLGKPLG